MVIKSQPEPDKISGLALPVEFIFHVFSISQKIKIIAYFLNFVKNWLGSVGVGSVGVGSREWGIGNRESGTGL